MLSNTLKAALCALAFSATAYAATTPMEPLVAIDKEDADYAYYLGALNQEKEFRDQGLVNGQIWQIDHTFKLEGVEDVRTVGRVAFITDGSYDYPYNVIMETGAYPNTNLYYIDTVLTSIIPDENGTQFKIRRRWKNNPEPGIFIRIEGTRFNPVLGQEEVVQVWVKYADTEGNSLRVLKTFEGNYDIAD